MRMASPSVRTSIVESSFWMIPGFSAVLSSAASRICRGVTSLLSQAARMSPSRASSMWASRVSCAMSATGTWTENLRVSSPSVFLTSTRNPLIR